jgi:hypothetical protein
VKEFLIYLIATPPGIGLGLALSHALGVGPFHKTPAKPVRKPTPPRTP